MRSMKHSIKREQSHARMSFAEFENQRSLAEGESNVRATLKHMKLSFHLILTLAAMLTMAQTAWATDETKVFSNSNITAGSTNQLNYEGNLFISATGDATVSKGNYNPYSIAMRAPYQQEGTLRLYPRISGKVKSIVFSSAYMFADEGYMKIGKGSTWTNSISEKNEGNNPWKSFEFTNADGIQLDNESDYLEIKLYHATKNGSFFSKGSITITYEPTASTLTHTHNFSYSKNGSTLTATCAHNDGKDCSLASDNWQISTTLTPPTFPAYGQYVYHPATLSNIAGFTTETGATAGDITYVNNTTNQSLGTSSPHDIGAYTASVTITAGGTGYTLTTSYSVGTFCGINTNYPQFTTDKEGNYALDGETVTLTFTSLYGETLTAVTATGATSGNDITLTSTGANTYTFTMPQEEVNIGATISAPDASNFEQTGENEYTIKTANGWGWFCFATNYDLAPYGFGGKVVKLAGNVSSSEMAGKSGHPFKGTFDGQNYTLTFNRTAAEDFCAPFHYINGATISNLHVGGTITGGTYENLGGLVGHSEGNITINNCRVSTEISTTVSGSALHGGVIGTWNGSYATCTVTGCVYDGLIYNPNEAGVTTSCHGFIGWDYGNSGTIKFTDCLSAPAAYGMGKYALGGNCFTFVFPNSEPTLTYNMTNCYYTSILGNRQGRPAATVTVATTAPANLGAATTDHGIVDGYKNGFIYNGKYYTPKYGDAVVEYRFDDDEERADVTINGTNNQETGVNVVGVNITEEVGNIKSVTYNRPFNTAQAATVILPFNYICNDSEGGKFYGFQKVEYDEDAHKWVCTMEEPSTGSLTANTPYLFMPSETTMTFPNIVSMTGGVVTLQPTTANDGDYEFATTDEAWKFHGSYKGKSWAVASNDYGFAAQSGIEAGGAATVDAGQFVRFTTNAFIKPMRCYLSYVGTSAPAPARGLTRSAAATDDLPQSITVRLVSRNGETTAIGEIDTKTGKLTFDSEAWYTLDGVRLSGKPSTKGIYINNGRKIVIK